MFHVEIDNGNNAKSILEIHLKNPLEFDNDLQNELINLSEKKNN